MERVNKAGGYHIAFEATLLEARHGVQLVFRHLDTVRLPEDLKQAAQIALTEAVNNVVEHAYTETKVGRVDLWVNIRDEQVQVRIEDTGRALPKSVLSHAAKRALPDRRRDLPEGGFGWQMIQSLAHEVQYSRSAGRNRLTLCFGETANASKVGS